MDFTSWDKMPLRQNRERISQARFKSGLFESHLVKIRKNLIRGLDGWTPLYPYTDKSFYDVTNTVKQTIERGPNYKNEQIFEMEIHLDNDEVIHTRKVFMYMDWLGILGGLRNVLHTIFIGVVFKSYSNLNSIIETLESTDLFQSIVDQEEQQIFKTIY
jgi:hypothetical protein